MKSNFSDILKIKEPGGIHLNSQKNGKDRAPIDIAITRSNTIEFPWESSIGLLPDDIDIFREKIKTSLDIKATNWDSLDLTSLIYKVQQNDTFYYTLVQWLNYDNHLQPTLSENSKVLIYNKLSNLYYEPYYYDKDAITSKYKTFKKEKFSRENINETFKEITHLRAVFRPKAPDINLDILDNLPTVNIPPRTVNPINGGFLNLNTEVLSNRLSDTSKGFSESLNFVNLNSTTTSNYNFPSLRSELNKNISIHGTDYINGTYVTDILNQAKSSHSKPEADPIKTIIKKPSQWKALEELVFYTTKEDVSANLESSQLDLLLVNSDLSNEHDGLFYEQIQEENNWILKLDERYYVIQLEEEDAKFNTLESFFSRWDTNIKDVELVAYKKGTENLKNVLPSSKYFDVTLSAIMDQYQDIKSLQKLSKGRATLAESLIKKVSDIGDFEFEEFKEALSNIEDKHNTLVKSNNDLIREERVLIERIKRFGYEIELGADGNAQIFKTYSLLRLIKKAFRIRKRYKVRIGLFRVKYKTKWYTRYTHKWIRVTNKKIIPIPETPWSDEVEALKDSGYDVHFLELTNQGYISDQGETLNEIMRACEISESIRMRTAVMIPQYEESITKGLRLVGYDLFTRPLPGDVPTSIPNVSVEENLAYRASWRGVELSELIESINLAPGESRNISIKQTFESQKTQTQSITSILDVTEKKSTTFSDFFEQTNRKSKEKTSNKNWSAKASGSYGGFGGSASGGGSTTKTSKSFAQEIKRAANESSREMKKQSRVEVNSKLSESSKLIVDESITSQIQNINDGVSLNLFFYRLDNVYQGGLHLENLKLTYTRPQPLIKGTNLQDIRTFEFYEFEEFLNMVTNDTLLVLVTELTEMELELKEIEIRFSIVFKVFKKIFKEYFYNIPSEAFLEYPEPLQSKDIIGSGESIDAQPVSSSLLSLVNAIKKQKLDYQKVRAKLKTYVVDNKEWWDEYRVLFEPLKEIQETIEAEAYQLLNGVEYGLIPISGAHLFSIPSNGAYLDCLVGSSSGLEKYSEDMRNEELNRQKAEIELIRAQSQKIFNENSTESYPITSIKINKVRIEDGDLHIDLDKSLPADSWIIKVNNLLYGSNMHQNRKLIILKNWNTSLEEISSIRVIASNGIYIEKKFE
ncbi:hypothetical protein [uncultured Dokdonia sp.]|uniref:hypothetical protein n=1 Tax=uncultured Dokdonia sp. TaxID=575653 RepID=UPI00261BB92E|nr:hypothetical protein [uncultured Dokdonia sp.]